MVVVTVEKSELEQLNDKRYVFPDSTPQQLIKDHELKCLKYEQGILASNERMRIFNSVITQQPVFYKKRCEKFALKNIETQCHYTTRDY